MANEHEHFWRRVRRGKPDECWPWQRAKSPQGYGSLWQSGTTVEAHRVAYELARGPIPDGMIVLHSCDNPSCCNPAHLRLGTYKDNSEDCFEGGRAPGRDGTLLYSSSQRLASASEKVGAPLEEYLKVAVANRFPIRQMAEDLGQQAATVTVWLNHYGFVYYQGWFQVKVLEELGIIGSSDPPTG